jgi:hypothetical protein
MREVKAPSTSGYNPTPSPADRTEVDARLAWNKRNQADQYDLDMQRPGATRPWSVEDVTKGFEATGQGMQTASLAGLIPGMQMAGAGLFAGGEIMQAPENIRRGMANPDDAMGYGEGALRALGILMGAKSGGRAAAAGEDVGVAGAKLRKTFGVRQGSEVPYQAPGTLPSAAAVPEPPFRAMQELNTPGAQRYMREQFAQNNPIARRILPGQVDPGTIQQQADDILSRFPKTPPKRLPPSSTSAAERAGYPQVEADEILGSPWGDDLNNLFTGRERQLKANQHARDFRKKPGQD